MSNNLHVSLISLYNLDAIGLQLIEGKSDKATHEWLISAEYPRNRQQRYNNMLMAATQYDNIPKWQIRFLKSRTIKIPLLVHLLSGVAIFFNKMRKDNLYTKMRDTLQSKMGGKEHGHLH